MRVSSRAAGAVERLVAAALLSITFLGGLDRIPMHQDESLWIACSLYLEAALDDAFVPPAWFREGVLRELPPAPPGEAWSPRLTWGRHYFSLDQPPVARYLLAIGRRLHGYGPEALNRPWRWELDAAENARLGNVPAPGLLLAARRSSAALSIASGLLLYGLVRSAAGRVAGLGFVLLFSTSGYLLVHLRRAMGEPALLFFSALGLWAGARALRAAGEAVGGEAPAPIARRAFPWLAATGFAAGLAGSSKLNGLGLAGAGVVLAVALAVRVPNRGLGARLALAAAGGLCVVVPCVATFYAVNPSLHRDPVAHARAMVELRSRELAGNQRDARWGLQEPGRRVVVVLGRTFETYGPARTAWVNVPLALAGLLVLLVSAARWARGSGGAPAAVALLAGAILAAGPALLTPVDWDRYYLFPVVFTTVLVAAGGAALAERVVGLAGALGRGPGGAASGADRA
jgi:hypothetical protein